MFTIRKTAGREAQIKELERRTGFSGVAAMFDYALNIALEHTEETEAKMGWVKVLVGSTSTDQSGHYYDNTNEAEFQGEKIADRTSLRGGNTTGADHTLYRTSDGRLIVHVYNWTLWQGGSDTYSLHQVEREALEPGGRFGDLGRESDLSRPMTLDEALATPETC